MQIIPGALDDRRVVDLLASHAQTARSHTAEGSAHALDLDGLRSEDISLWTIWDGDALAGVGALKSLTDRHGEIKSMHTAPLHRRRGVGGAMLAHLIAVAGAKA